MTKIKLLVIQKLEFESLTETLAVYFLEQSDSCGSHARIELNDIHTECFSTKIELLDKTMVDDIKSVVSEKMGFENRDQSKLTAFS